MPGPSDPFWQVLAFLLGAVVGSFLNVVIWRLPRGESLVSPGSHCPHCNRPLLWWENIPLVSFLALRARCRTCRKPIAWRYFWVELVTAVLFWGMIRMHGATVDGVAFCIFAAALVAAFMIDSEHYIIPDSINVVALLAGFGRDLAGVLRTDPAHSLYWGWLPRSVAGAVVCAAAFVLIQALGLALFRKDAMGDGDVKLARAIGAMLPLPLAFMSFLFAVGIGAVVGGALCIVRAMRRGPGARLAPPEADADAQAPEPTPWGIFWLAGLLYVSFLDLVVGTAQALRVRWAVQFMQWWDRSLPEGDEEEEFVPLPTQVPFGPFMVVGTFLSLLVGRQTLEWYLRWAGFIDGT